MDPIKLHELKQRAKSAFGISQVQLNKKEKNHFSSSQEATKINTIKNNYKGYKLKTNTSKPNSNMSNRNQYKTTSEYDFISKFDNSKNNLSYNQRLERGTDGGYGIDEYHPFILSANSKNIININNKLISDLNEQINILNERKRAKRFNYKQTVNLQKLNDYIIYEYTKNKMEFNKMNNKKTSTSFRLPLQYRRMGNHGKKEDLIPINNLPKINLEDILILHNSNTRSAMTKHKVQNYYLKNNMKYKKYKLNPHINKEYSEDIALKFINIL